MSLHPIVQLKVDDISLTNVPPEYLTRFVYKSMLGGLCYVDFTVLDPAFTDLESVILQADSKDYPIQFRFGYPTQVGSFDGRNWIRTRLINFVPELSSKGMSITASCLADTSGKGVSIIEPKSYKGKISKVVEQIADDMGIEAEIEETDDDDNDAFEDNDGSPREWSSKNLPLVEFIRGELLPKARSKTSKSNYEFWISGGELSSTPVLHFHTREYSNCLRRNRPVYKLTYLGGRQGQVISFRPNYDSKLLGSLGAGQVVLRYYDPATRKYVSKSQDLVNNADSTSLGEGGKSSAGPTNQKGSKQSTQAFILARELLASDADAVGRNSWEASKSATFTAELELVGLPEFLDLDANDLIDINVLIPPVGTATQWERHYSSGIYLVTEAVHTIEGQYTIQCQLQRDMSGEGSVDAASSPAVTF